MRNDSAGFVGNKNSRGGNSNSDKNDNDILNDSNDNSTDNQDKKTNNKKKKKGKAELFALPALRLDKERKSPDLFSTYFSQSLGFRVCSQIKKG